EGTMDAEALRRAEDAAVSQLVQMQESVGLSAATDGEMRRSFWHYDFMGGLTGLDLVERGEGIQFQGATLRPIYPTITGELDFPDDHPMLSHFEYLASVSKVQPKISIPGPSCCHFRTAKADIAPPQYADVDVLFDDLKGTYAKAVQAFYDRGCRYLQMDDIFFAYLCDPKIRAQKKAEGLDPDWLVHRYAEMMRESIQHRPADMVVAMHMCRGNFQSTWVAEGGYDPVADAVFNETGVDVFFMEYDSERAGGLDPLRLLAKGTQRVMLGFITTKSAELESVEAVCGKIDQAANYVELGQLGIAPQCGFASTEEGNKLGYDDQRRKLELVVNVAQTVWGGVRA
ncbi:MAG: 5-methyltetrahydropteroyltriglutamate--homocysteine S-methyltransferase, partial [Chromatiales bacterium]|nr:5-methyltetrahydropteroyltriglutamate--homocysteine S-methyltransferase [Chromatiales bacterium]